MKYFVIKILFFLFWLFAMVFDIDSSICRGEVSQNNSGPGSFMNNPSPVITSLSPTQGFNSGRVLLTIQGQGFPEQASLKLVRNEVEISGWYLKNKVGEPIQCFFDLTHKPFGDYDLVLTRLDGRKYVFKDSFRIRIFILAYHINLLIKPIYFDYDNYHIREDQAELLQKNIEYLAANPEDYILLEGCCDSQGSIEYNLELSQKRVESVKQAILKAGIPVSRVFGCYYGKQYPYETGIRTFESKRRVNIILSETSPYK
jgi:outer membrane protein OmpA-like peptidoglycan-associated protein